MSIDEARRILSGWTDPHDDFDDQAAEAVRVLLRDHARLRVRCDSGNALLTETGILAENRLVECQRIQALREAEGKAYRALVVDIRGLLHEAEERTCFDHALARDARDLRDAPGPEACAALCTTWLRKLREVLP